MMPLTLVKLFFSHIIKTSFHASLTIVDEKLVDRQGFDFLLVYGEITAFFFIQSIPSHWGISGHFPALSLLPLLIYTGTRARFYRAKSNFCWTFKLQSLLLHKCCISLLLFNIIMNSKTKVC